MVAPGREDTPLQCPRCNTAMRKQRNKRAVIDHCDKCDGNFFDEGEMLAVLGKAADPEVWARSNRKRTPSASEINCPSCHARMQLHPLGQDDIDVDVDFCVSCGGIWLDGGEVQAVLKIGARHLVEIAHEKKAAKAKAAPKASTTPAAKDSGPEMLGEFLAMFSKE